MMSAATNVPTVLDLANAVKAGDQTKVRSLLHAAPELVGMDMTKAMSIVPCVRV